MAGILLRSGSVKQFSPLGATGNPVYSAASQLRAAIRRQLGQDVADYFAVPVQDEKGQTIDWYSAFDGDVVPWTSATPDERGPARASLLAARERLLEKSRALQASEDSEQQVFGKLLALATRIPGEDHVYLVGGRPVMTFWGFSEREASAERDVLGTLDVGSISVSGAAGHVPPVAPVARSKWRWLWLVLPLLLLLGLLLFGLKSCAPELGLSGFMRDEPTPTPLPVGEQAADSKNEVPVGTASPGPQEGASIEAHRDDATGVDGAGRGDRYGRDVVNVDRTVEDSRTVVDSTSEGQSPGGVTDTENWDSGTEAPSGGATSMGEDGALGDEPGPDDANMAETGTPGDEAAQQDANAGEQAAGEKQADEAGQPPEDKEPAKTEPPSEVPSGKNVPETANTTKLPGAPLTIPKDAAKKGSTEFMSGQWRSVTGLQDTSGNPVQLEYDFKGKAGMARLKRLVGGKEMECTAPVTSSFSGSKLVIDQSGDIRCPDGSSIQRSKVECSTDPQGHAVCKGRNPDGSDYNVRITKK